MRFPFALILMEGHNPMMVFGGYVVRRAPLLLFVVVVNFVLVLLARNSSVHFFFVFFCFRSCCTRVRKRKVYIYFIFATSDLSVTSL